MVERKCLNCGTWNNDEKYCKQCGEAVHPEEIVLVEAKAKRLAEENKPKDKFEIFAEKCKNHKYGIVRAAYQLVYGIGVVLGAIGGFLAWLVAMANA